MARRNPEYHSCVGLVEWWGYACRSYGLAQDLLIHIPNQGHNPRSMVHLKRMGLRPGVPDYFLAVPRGSSAGLWIEMKSDVGKLSPNQAVFSALLNASGYLCVVCRSAMEARDVIENYLKSESRIISSPSLLSGHQPASQGIAKARKRRLPKGGQDS